MRSIRDIREELEEYTNTHLIVNTHSHHMPETAMREFGLDELIANTYLRWIGAAPGNTRESREAFLGKVKYKSYFVWLQKAVQQLYGAEWEITPQNWETVSGIIRETHKKNNFYLDVLKKKCHYEKIIVETYWNPGSDNGRAEIFRPSFRIDSFLYGYGKNVCDHDGIYPEKEYGVLPDNLPDYVAWVRNWILQKKKEGCVALKSAIAYERDIHFKKVSKENAEKVFLQKDGQKTREQIIDFQNYLFYQICEMAAEFSLPMQCHTGTGQLSGTRALELLEVIREKPDTKFAILHCGYPWVDDIFGMLDENPNVYPDLSWLPILSYTASERALHELIETSMADKICWGCDTWTAEESYGALLAFRFVMVEVLEKKIKDGYLSIDGAKEIIDRIMIKNAKELYGV